MKDNLEIRVREKKEEGDCLLFKVYAVTFYQGLNLIIYYLH